MFDNHFDRVALDRYLTSTPSDWDDPDYDEDEEATGQVVTEPPLPIYSDDVPQGEELDEGFARKAATDQETLEAIRRILGRQAIYDEMNLRTVEIVNH